MGERFRTATFAVLLVVAGFAGPVGTGAGAAPESSHVIEPHAALHVFEPKGPYFVGQEVDVSGIAATGIDEIAVYVREQGEWELLDINEDGVLNDEDTISVGDEGLWVERNVVLSNASSMLRFPGDYQFGVIDAVDARRNGTLRPTIDTGQFVSATSNQVVLTVRQPRLEGTFLAIGGEVATDDGEVSIQGIARGQGEVLAVVVDFRGRIATAQVATRGQYDVLDEDVALQTADGRSLSEGPMTAFLLALGRDSVAGDGHIPGQPDASIDSLQAYVAGLDSQLRPRQVRERIFEQTTEEAGSDDLAVVRSFTYASGMTTVESVGPASGDVRNGVHPVEVGETMVVRGRTNRKPDDNTIRVEATGGPSASRLPVAGTDDWGLDGRWSVSIDTEGLEPGVYSFAVGVDNETVDRVQVRVVAEGRSSNRSLPSEYVRA